MRTITSEDHSRYRIKRKKEKSPIFGYLENQKPGMFSIQPIRCPYQSTIADNPEGYGKKQRRNGTT